MRSAILLAALLSVAGGINYCGVKMCGRTDQHTFCQFHSPGPDCVGYIEDRLTHDEKVRVLARLNRRRSDVAGGKLQRLPTAGNMLKLHWVEELAREAQLWADQCVPPSKPEEHDDCRDLFSITVGQCVSSVAGEAPGLRPESMVDTWFLQGHLYKGNVTSYVSSDKYADFAQMIWAHTFMVGCARSRFMTEIHERSRIVIRLVCNFAPRGPAGELWLPATPAAACPAHTQVDTDLPNLCVQMKNTSKTDQPNEITLEERTVLNAVLELDDNPSLAQRVSLDEIYLTNMAIATLNHSATIESYFKSKHKHDIIEAIVLEDDKQINKAQNSIQETANGISMRTKRTKLVKKISTIGRPKSYDIEELGDLYMDGYSNTSPVETTPLIERELYADNEMQDVSETPAEYDDTAIILNNAVELTSMPIAALELNSTEDVSSTHNLSVHPTTEVSNSIRTEEIIRNRHLLRLLELSKINEAFPFNPQTAEALQDALEHVEKTLSGETSGKVRRELKRNPDHPPQPELSQDYTNQVAGQDVNMNNDEAENFRISRSSSRDQEPQENPGPPDNPIRTLDKTPTLNMILKYLPFMKDYERYMSLCCSNKPCVVIIFVFVCFSLGCL